MLTIKNFVVPILLAATAAAQPPAGGRGGRGGGGGGFANAYPQRPPGDPAMIERGNALYGVNCQFCHGGDARGGEGGPNLIRAEIVLNDQNGESIAPVIQNGRVDQVEIWETALWRRPQAVILRRPERQSAGRASVHPRRGRRHPVYVHALLRC